MIGGGTSQPGGVIFFNDQEGRGAVGILGPVGTGGDGYNFRVPLNSPANPSTLTDPILLVTDATQSGNTFSTYWTSANDLGLGPGEDSTPSGGQHQVQYNNSPNGFGGSEGLSIEFGTCLLYTSPSPRD